MATERAAGQGPGRRAGPPRLPAALLGGALWLAAAGPGLAPPARAAAEPAPLLLDEDQAVAAALRDNLALRAFRRERDVAEGQVVSAAALQNPSLRLDLLHVQEEPARVGWGLELKWAPPQPVELLARRAGARAQLDAVRGEIGEREWLLGAEVRKACAALREIGEQARLGAEALELRRRIAAVLRTRLGRGGATRIEQNLADLSVLRAQREVDEIALRRAQAESELRALLGVVSEAPIALKGEAPPLRPEATPDPAALSQDALSLRPGLRAAYARVQQRREQVRAEQTRRYPWVELSGRYRQNQAGNYPHDVQLGVELTLPLLNQNAGPLRTAEALRDRDQALAEAQAQALAQAVYAACAELKARGVILLRFQRELLPVLQEHERLMESAARGAEVDLSALLGSEEIVLRGRRDHAEARLAYRRALLSLQAAVGRPLAEVSP